MTDKLTLLLASFCKAISGPTKLLKTFSWIVLYRALTGIFCEEVSYFFIFNFEYIAHKIIV